jgi:hypothetical protein
MDLAVFDLAPAHWRGDDGDRNLFYFDASLRFDSDFGGYLLGRPGGSDEIRELKQSQLDILYAFVGGRNIGGRVDFELGRQIHFDLVDFFAFDGGDAIVHVTRNFAVQASGAPRSAASCRCRRRLRFDEPARVARSRDAPGQNEVLRLLVGVVARGRRSADGAPRVPAGLVGDGRSLPGEPLPASTTRSSADGDGRLAQPRCPRAACD